MRQDCTKSILWIREGLPLKNKKKSALEFQGLNKRFHQQSRELASAWWLVERSLLNSAAAVYTSEASSYLLPPPRATPQNALWVGAAWQVCDRLGAGGVLEGPSWGLTELSQEQLGRTQGEQEERRTGVYKDSCHLHGGVKWNLDRRVPCPNPENVGKMVPLQPCWLGCSPLETSPCKGYPEATRREDTTGHMESLCASAELPKAVSVDTGR